MDATLAGLRALVTAAAPEGLQLEFKRKQDPSVPGLSRDDSRAVAEAVAAFANSEGGVLVLGIRSERRDGADVAAELVPMVEVGRLAGEVRTVAELNVSPQVRGLEVVGIALEDGSSDGFIVVNVPPSDVRPHMSTARGVHRYYRRGFTGSEIMTPGEVRDQILAVREAVVEPIVTAAQGGGFSNYKAFAAVQSSIQIRLRNVGVRLCRDPFLRVSSDCQLQAYSVAFDQRLNAWKPDYPPGMMIHVGDESPILSLRYLARIDAEVFYKPAELSVERLVSAVSILPGADQHNEAAYFDPSLDAIRLSITWGADNATARSANFVLTRRELAASILTGASDVLRDMYHEVVGTWREDVFAALSSAGASDQHTQ